MDGDLEGLFSYYDTTDVQMYLYVKCMFKGEVEDWWLRNHSKIRIQVRARVKPQAKFLTRGRF